ncbi:hypothetical protein IAR50_005624 [Cryptococcus sp. DSM 104548]
MWLHYPWLAGAQSASAAVAIASTAATMSASTSTSSAAATTFSGTPYLVIHDVADMVACGTGQIYWNVYNEDASKYNITVYAVNEGVDQTIESPSTTVVSSTSAAASSAVAQTSSAVATTSNIARSLANPLKRTTLSINTTIITQYANHGYGWTPVRLPEGNYRIYAHVYDGHSTSNTSNVFTVRESTNTSCLTAFAAMSKTASATLSNGKVTGSAESVSASASLGAAAGSSDEGGASGLSGGAIAGIVVGVVVGLAVLSGLLFCLRRRRQQARRGTHGDDPPMGMTHRRMASASTAPSDSGHSPLHTMTGQGSRAAPIALGAAVQEQSFTSSMDKDSEESFGQATTESAAPVVLAGGGQKQEEEEEVLQEDPFRSPAPAQDPTTAYTQPTSVYDPSRRYSNPAGALPTDQRARNSLSSSQPCSPQRLPRRSPSSSSNVGESPRVGGALGRTPSSRRKPVPSLGPELRGELAKKADEQSQEEGKRAMASVGLGVGNVGQGNGAQSRRTSYQLMPDPPLAPPQE